MSRLSPRMLGAVVAVISLALDQLSKNFLLYGLGVISFRPGQSIPILPFFDIVMLWNRGVSYGLFQAGSMLGTVVLTVFSLAAVVVLSWWLWRAANAWLAAGLGLIIGGALGNVIDRMLYGAVADFFHFYAFGHDWYVFNVADAAITFGVITLLADTFFRKDGEGKETGAGT